MAQNLKLNPGTVEQIAFSQLSCCGAVKQQKLSFQVKLVNIFRVYTDFIHGKSVYHTFSFINHTCDYSHQRTSQNFLEN